MSNAIAVRDKRQAIERLTTSLEQIVTIRSEWLDDKRAELARAIEAQTALAGTGAGETKLRYNRNRVAVLRKIVNCLEAGFVPMPSFESEKVNVDIRGYPIKALMAINDAQATGLFDEIRLVEGREPQARRGPYGRTPARDPLLIGVVRSPASIIDLGQEWARDPFTGQWMHKITLPSIEQHFLVAWWKPSDEVAEDLF